MVRASAAGLRAWLSIVATALPLVCAAQAERGAPAASAPARPASAVARNGNGTANGNGAENGNAAANGSAAAMERARRAAESPLRAILEASKVRRRIDAESPAEAEAAPTPVVVLPLVAPPTPVITIRTLPEEPVAAGAAASAAALLPLAEATSRAPASELSRPVQGPPALTLIEPVVRPPELLRVVEPEANPRLIEQLSRPEVAVEFTIAADGSVGAVQVQPPVPRALVPKIVEAVEQWRYAPARAPRRHRVQLVFKTGG